jgi:hypothetical protein
MTKYYVQSRATNRKTGNIPQIGIGANPEECIKSCLSTGCEGVPKKFGGKGKWNCYALNGLAWVGAGHVWRKFARVPEAYELHKALAKRKKTAKALRIGSIGDPSALSQDQAKEIRQAAKKAGLFLIGYTHGWRFADHWKGYIMASCGSLEEADEAIDKGWSPTIIMPKSFEGTGPMKNIFHTPKGRKGIMCPNQVHRKLIKAGKSKTSPITCNDCKKCDPKGNPIGFYLH